MFYRIKLCAQLVGAQLRGIIPSTLLKRGLPERNLQVRGPVWRIDAGTSISELANTDHGRGLLHHRSRGSRHTACKANANDIS